MISLHEVNEELSEAVRSLHENAADTILKQLGGQNRVQTMIGVKQFLSDNGGRTLILKFTNPKRNKPNFVKITLNGKDLYDIEFGRTGKKKDKQLGISLPSYKVIKKTKDIYSDSLVDVFEKNTGLYLRM